MLRITCGFMLCLLLFFSGNLKADSGVHVAVLGDSASVGSLTNTRLGQWPYTLARDLGSVLKGLISEKIGIQIALLGNTRALRDKLLKSLLQGIQKKQDLPQNTAARTREPWGVLAKIAEIEQADPERVRLTSYVRNGARWSDKNVEGWVERLSNTRDIPDYLFILLGANDFCHEKRDINEWVAGVERHLHRLTARLKNTKIYMTNIPDFRKWRAIDPVLEISENVSIDIDETIDLGVLGRKKILLKKDIPMKERLNLNSVRKNLCENLYHSEDVVSEMVSLFNKALEDVSEKFRTNHVRLIDIFPVDVDPEDLAVDGFHLNRDGQKKLSLHLREAL